MKGVLKKIVMFVFVPVLLLSTFTTNLLAYEQKNDYPVVLVHGNAGWGRDEVGVIPYYLQGMDDILYWGGYIDLQEELNAKGFRVFTGVVGPFSSNWDRACELYAYITGGTVDYGKAHSDRYGHDRYGRTFDGLYEDWGDQSSEGINKIHLIGHSQGGQTVRLMVQLLEEGMKSEVEAVLGPNPTTEEIKKAVDKGDLSKLFTGMHCNDWVASVSTFATPNDGTTLADLSLFVDDTVGLFAQVFGSLTGADSLGPVDLKLDQWGLTQKDGESNSDFIRRALGSELFSVGGGASKDFSNYDLSTLGGREMNKWVKDQPNVYYFSRSFNASKRALLGYNQIPYIPYMNPTMYASGTAIGAYLNYLTGITSAWLPNDGIVNTISENGPKLGRSYDNIVDFSGTNPQIGKWNAFKIMYKTDHEDIVGRDTSDAMGDLMEFYTDYMEMLQSL